MPRVTVPPDRGVLLGHAGVGGDRPVQKLVRERPQQFRHTDGQRVQRAHDRVAEKDVRAGRPRERRRRGERNGQHGHDRDRAQARPPARLASAPRRGSRSAGDAPRLRAQGAPKRPQLVCGPRGRSRCAPIARSPAPGPRSRRAARDPTPPHPGPAPSARRAGPPARPRAPPDRSAGRPEGPRRSSSVALTPTASPMSAAVTRSICVAHPRRASPGACREHVPHRPRRRGPTRGASRSCPPSLQCSSASPRSPES